MTVVGASADGLRTEGSIRPEVDGESGRWLYEAMLVHREGDPPNPLLERRVIPIGWRCQWVMEGHVSRIFLSHSSVNNAEAVTRLAEQGWDDAFLDLNPERGIAAGERWERAQHEAASRCEAVLFLVSRAWLDSRWCQKELTLADKLNKRLFVVLIEPFDPAELATDLSKTWQIVDLASGRDHRLFRVTLPRTQEESHVHFSAEGLTRLKAGLVKAGLDPRFFDWPPLVFTQPWPSTSSEKARGIPDRIVYYQYRQDRARRTLR